MTFPRVRAEDFPAPLDPFPSRSLVGLLLFTLFRSRYFDILRPFSL